MSGAVRVLGWTLGAAAGLTLLAAATPHAFRSIDAFTIERVELTGARYLSAEEAMTRAGITDSSNVFDDAGAWAAALLEHPLVLAVRVERRPPSALRFHVTEAVPVALVQTPSLQPVDARGRLLPIDPAGHDLDLPVLAAAVRPGPDSALDEQGRRLIDAFVTLQGLDAGFALDVSELGPAPGGGVRVILERPPGTELLLPDVPDARILYQLRLALEHIRGHDGAQAGRAAPSGAAPSPVRIDARYRDELFVTMPERRTS
ncbi:MAG: FtsQ-type POTRA domain-containing protein [Gemmatimonadetes bacterium]|nr:FtsQ-type POTRA domain-containing protein [Gemmatimonadota bacterium]